MTNLLLAIRRRYIGEQKVDDLLQRDTDTFKSWNIGARSGDEAYQGSTSTATGRKDPLGRWAYASSPLPLAATAASSALKAPQTASTGRSEGTLSPSARAWKEIGSPDSTVGAALLEAAAVCGVSSVHNGGDREADNEAIKSDCTIARSDLKLHYSHMSSAFFLQRATNIPLRFQVVLVCSVNPFKSYMP